MHPVAGRRAWRGALALGLALVAPACAGSSATAGTGHIGVGLTHTGCPPETSHGSGIEIEPGVVLTAAHVLKGADEIVVSDAERTTTGTIIGFDPQMDLALVRLADPLGDVVPLADLDDVAEADVEGADGAAYVMRDGAIVEIPVKVQRKINLRTEDIYIDGEYDRPAWELEAVTKAGDSGGAVVVDGHVIGVLSLRSNRYESRAYAIDPVRAGGTIRAQSESGDLGPVDLARCT